MSFNNTTNSMTTSWEERREETWAAGESPDMSPGMFVFFSTWLAFCGIFGIGSNGLVIVGFLRNKQVRQTEEKLGKISGIALGDLKINKESHRIG